MARISAKSRILSILNEHKGTYYSGQTLADEIGVSRTAIWKAITTLREEGYAITGSTNLGYALSADTDLLDAAGVCAGLSEEARAFYQVECRKTIDSTNTALRIQAQDGAPEGRCLISEEQTAGRGRSGRSFYSPSVSGLYLSILLRPTLSFDQAVLITTAASVAAAKACEAVNPSLKDGDIKIKWVNDLFLNGKKISGILTEAGFSMETGSLDYAVMGIGFNLKDPEGGWPDGLASIAGSLFDEQIPVGTRNSLSAAFLDEFYKIYKTLPAVSYLDDYRSRQLAIGRTVTVNAESPNPRRAYVLDVNDRCELIVRFEGDIRQTILNSGEIRIRL